MCGRYAAARSSHDLADTFDAADRTAEEVGARFNVAPGTGIRVVVSRAPERDGGDRRRELRVVRWGLIPPWVRDPATARPLINARAETAAAKPAFRRAVAARRCLVPADGWFEWRQRVPYYLSRRDGAPLAFAGIYEHHRRGEGQVLTTCAILTTAAQGALVDVHDRMPLLLPPSAWQAWLDPEEEAGPLLAPPVPQLVAAVAMRRVAPAVGNVRNDGPELIAEVGAQP